MVSPAKPLSQFLVEKFCARAIRPDSPVVDAYDLGLTAGQQALTHALACYQAGETAPAPYRNIGRIVRRLDVLYRTPEGQQLIQLTFRPAEEIADADARRMLQQVQALMPAIRRSVSAIHCDEQLLLYVHAIRKGLYASQAKPRRTAPTLH